MTKNKKCRGKSSVGFSQGSCQSDWKDGDNNDRLRCESGEDAFTYDFVRHYEKLKLKHPARNSVTSKKIL